MHTARIISNQVVEAGVGAEHDVVVKNADISDLLSGNASYIEPFAVCVICCFHLPSVLQLLHMNL